MIKQTLDEWRTEAKERFGDKTTNWKFICPSCGNVQSPQTFVGVGCTPEEAVNRVYQECTGRHGGNGCKWAAFGFLGTLGKGRIVIAAGSEVEVFDFAPEV